MNSERYCGRCGEDGAIWFYRCEMCGREFCDDCATRREVDDQVCCQCREEADRKLVAAESGK